jgi:hypothetical protein
LCLSSSVPRASYNRVATDWMSGMHLEWSTQCCLLQNKANQNESESNVASASEAEVAFTEERGKKAQLNFRKQEDHALVRNA